MSAKDWGWAEIVVGIVLEFTPAASIGTEMIIAGAATEASIMLAPSPPQQDRAPVEGTLLQTNAFANIVYGRRKVGSNLVYENSSGANKDVLDIVVCHSITTSNGIEGFGSFWLNDREIRVAPAAIYQLNHNYSVGDAIKDSNGNGQECVAGGLSGANGQPVWKTKKGQITLDGVVKWKMIGSANADITWDNNTTQGSDGLVRPSNPTSESFVHGTVTGGTFAGMVEVWGYMGTQTKYTMIDPTLYATYGSDPDLPWAQTAIGVKWCWTHWRFNFGSDSEKFQKAFGSSLPYKLEVEIKGEKIKDIRTGNTIYSENAANIARDFLTRPVIDGGCEIDPSVLDDTNATIPSANVCDQTANMADGSQGPRYRCSGIVSCGNKRRDELQKIMLSMYGTLVNRSTSVNNLAPICIFAGAYTSPAGTIDETFIAGSSVIKGVDENSRYNVVDAQFDDRYNLYQPMPAPPVPALNSATFATWLAEDANREKHVPLQLDFVDNADNAQIIAQIKANQSRYQERLILKCNYRAIKFNVWDRIWYDNAELGIAGDIYRIERITKTASWGINVQLVQDDPSIWGATTPQTGSYGPDSKVVATTPPASASLTVTPNAAGNLLQWPLPDPHVVKRVIIYYSADGGNNYTKLDNVGAGAGGYQHALANGTDGYYYVVFSNGYEVSGPSPIAHGVSALAENGAVRNWSTLFDDTGGKGLAEAAAKHALLFDMSSEPKGWIHIDTSKIVADVGVTGGSVLELTGWNYWRYSNNNNAPLIPYDPSKLYRLRVRARTTVDCTNYAQQGFYVGIQAIANNKTTTVGSSNGQLFVSFAPIYVADGWKTFEMWISGTSADNANNGKTPDSPASLINTAAYFSPELLVNYNTAGNNQVMQIDLVTVDIFDPDAHSRVYRGLDKATGKALDTLAVNGVGAATVQGNAQIGKDLNTPGSGKVANTDLADATAGLNNWKGSVPPTVAGLSFGYSVNSTGTAITISWGAYTIYLADGSTIAVASGNQSFSSLTSGHTYYFYPYYDTASGTVKFAGNANAARSAVSMQTQRLAGNIPLYDGGWAITATASATGGGSYGGCFHPEQPAVVKREGRTITISCGDVKAGDKLLTPSGWQPVLHVEHQAHENWIAVATNSAPIVEATPSQPAYTPDGSPVHFEDIRPGQELRARLGFATVTGVEKRTEKRVKVIITVPHPHLLYLTANGLELHNGSGKP